ncbi:hypothetical protein UVI_02014780 [Ustilaginoidea virens]|nr:hypothetical protein UVI_02014780 [Ustilaginoidea virens]
MTAPGSGLRDVAALAGPRGHLGNHVTYTSFGEPDEFPQRLDFVFVRDDPGSLDVDAYAVLPNSFDDQVRFSDHRPVVADMRLRL